jgi:hypothetical protein
VATEAALSAKAFAQAWAEGEARSLVQATDLAQTVLATLQVSEPADPAGSVSGGTAYPDKIRLVLIERRG